MIDGNKSHTKLSEDQQKEVKGGIPYEEPIFMELAAEGKVCGVGIICKSGNGTDCTDGQTCSKGTIPDPE